MDIEEAAESLQRTYLAAGFAAIGGNKDTIKAAFAAHEAAIRAGFLAVLEEAYLPPCDDSACESPACQAGLALRKRIEALGKEGT